MWLSSYYYCGTAFWKGCSPLLCRVTFIIKQVIVCARICLGSPVALFCSPVLVPVCQCLKYCISVVPLGPRGVPETLSGGLWEQNYFHSNNKILFALFTHSRTSVQLVFQRMRDMRYWNRLNTGADMRIQMSPNKPDIKEIYKNVRQCHSSRQIFLFWKTAIFS